MSQLAEQLQIFAPTHIRYPVVDATGLDGGWDLSFTSNPPIRKDLNNRTVGIDPYAPVGTTILKAVETLGLKLEAKKRSYPVMVIDHIEQKPTDN
jgi:uncharacterized protein (TIGR03435 family)